MGIFNAARSLVQKANTANASGNGMGLNAMVSRARTAAMPGNQMQPNAISPKAFSNQNTIGNVFGQVNPGTFTRTIGTTPLAQMTSQGYIPPMDPTNPTEQNDVNAIMAQTGGAPIDQSIYGEPIAPPYGVQTPITPTYDLNNQ